MNPVAAGYSGRLMVAVHTPSARYAPERIAPMNGRFSRLEIESRAETAPAAQTEPALLGNTVRTSHTDMQAAEDNASAATAIPVSERVSPFGEGKMDRDADDLRKRLPRGRPLKQVLIPVGDLPLRRRRTGDAR